MQTPIRDKQQLSTTIRTLPSEERMNRTCKNRKLRQEMNNHFWNLDDQSGYISDGPSQKYSIYKKSSSTNLDKSKSSSAKGLKSIFGR